MLTTQRFPEYFIIDCFNPVSNIHFGKQHCYYRVSHIEMSESKWFWRIEGSIILMIFLWRSHVQEQWTFDFWPLYFIQVHKVWPLKPLKERMPNIIEKMVFWRSIPQKEAVKMTEAKKITQYLNCLQFLSFLRSKRPSRSSRLLRSSCLMEPMRPLRSSDSLRNLNSAI